VRDSAIAARYAHALFLVTEKHGQTARALEDLLELRPLLAPHSRLGRFLAFPQVRLADKREVLGKALEGRVLPLIIVFLVLLLRKKRLRDFDTIVQEFESRVERSQGIQRAQVVSAAPLTETERTRLHQELERFTGGGIKLTSAIDPELIGGALVRIGDRVVDRSVSTLLRTVEKELLEVSV